MLAARFLNDTVLLAWFAMSLLSPTMDRIAMNSNHGSCGKPNYTKPRFPTHVFADPVMIKSLSRVYQGSIKLYTLYDLA